MFGSIGSFMVLYKTWLEIQQNKEPSAHFPAAQVGLRIKCTCCDQMKAQDEGLINPQGKNPPDPAAAQAVAVDRAGVRLEQGPAVATELARQVCLEHPALRQPGHRVLPVHYPAILGLYTKQRYTLFEPSELACGGMLPPPAPARKGGPVGGLVVPNCWISSWSTLEGSTLLGITLTMSRELAVTAVLPPVMSGTWRATGAAPGCCAWGKHKSIALSKPRFLNEMDGGAQSINLGGLASNQFWIRTKIMLGAVFVTSN
ncbi:hypothetical protein HPB49_026579 [Dermacentor silvarum]|nr:hypothetical protein HPB49_026579 [Dermacentor silvarum]